MNHSLFALTRKITWQLQEIEHQLLAFNQELTNLDQKIQENQQKILISCTIQAFILPEQEIARLNFMLNQQQHQDDYTSQKTRLVSQQELLKARHTGLKKELKMIKKHRNAQLKEKQQQDLIAQQFTSDEWFIQHREQA